jgi:hypothetical protein
MRGATSLADLRRALLRTPPLKAQFGPTLPELLAPQINRLPRFLRLLAGAVAVLVIAAVVLIVVRLRDPVYSHSGPPASFATSYSRAMTREPTPRGALLLLEQRSSIGLEDSFEISPLALPRYSGEISGLLPIVASNMIARLMRSDPTFVPWSRGRTRINKIPGYSFTYQRTIDGRPYWGRYVLITPDITGDRQGLLISLLTDPTPLLPIAKTPVTPDSVGTVGVLFEPFERLRFS